MKVICEQCKETWEEGGKLTKQILIDFARGHARNHRHTVQVIPEKQGETKQEGNEQPHRNS